MSNKELLWLPLDRITFGAEVPGGVLARTMEPSNNKEAGLAFIPNCVIQQEETDSEGQKHYSLQAMPPVDLVNVIRENTEAMKLIANKGD